MAIDGLDGYAEFLSGFVTGVAVGKQVEDLLLAAAQLPHIQRRLTSDIESLKVLEMDGHCSFTGMHFANGFAQLRGWSALVHIAVCAGGNGTNGVVPARRPRQSRRESWGRSS